MAIEKYSQYFGPPQQFDYAKSVGQGQALAGQRTQNALAEYALGAAPRQEARQEQVFGMQKQKFNQEQLEKMRSIYANGLAALDTSDPEKFIQQMPDVVQQLAGDLLNQFGEEIAGQDAAFLLNLPVTARSKDPNTGQYVPNEKTKDAMVLADYFKQSMISPETQAKLAATPTKPPQTRQVQRGDKNITQEWNGSKWMDIGEGPKWPPKSQTKWTIESDGSITFTQGPEGDTAAPTRAVVSDMEKDLGSAYEALSDLDEITNNYNKDYLTYQGKINAWALRKKSKANMPLTDEENKFLAGNRTFTQGVNQIFNKYRKWVTGAQAALAELEYLQQSMVNPNLAPAEFMPAVNQYRDALQRVIRIKNKLLREGFNVSNKKEWSAAMNDAWVSNEDDTFADRSEELMKIHKDKEKVFEIMRREGY